MVLQNTSMTVMVNSFFVRLYYVYTKGSCW